MGAGWRGDVNCYFWGNTKIVFTHTGKTAPTGKDIMNIDL